MAWTKQKLQQLKKSGNIRGWNSTGTRRPNSNNLGNYTNQLGQQGVAKSYIELNLQMWCNDQCMLLHTEFIFDNTHGRKWRFDWAIPSMKIAVEYEGIMSAKSRHTSVTGFTNDAEKYNKASQQGWKVIRLTAVNYTTLLNELNLCI